MTSVSREIADTFSSRQLSIGLMDAYSRKTNTRAKCIPQLKSRINKRKIRKKTSPQLWFSLSCFSFLRADCQYRMNKCSQFVNSVFILNQYLCCLDYPMIVLIEFD